MILDAIYFLDHFKHTSNVRGVRFTGDGFRLNDVLHLLFRLPQVESVILDAMRIDASAKCCFPVHDISSEKKVVRTVRITQSYPNLEMSLRFIGLLGGVEKLVVESDALLPRPLVIMPEEALRSAGVVKYRCYIDAGPESSGWPAASSGLRHLKSLQLLDTHAAGWGAMSPVYSHWGQCKSLEALTMTICPGGVAEKILAKLIKHNGSTLRTLTAMTRRELLPAIMCTC